MRLYGRPASQYPDFSALVPLPAPTPAGQVNGTSSSSVAKVNGASSHARSVPKIPAVPLNPSAFAPYGSVIQSYPDERAAPKEIKIKTVNFGTARKFNHLAPVEYVPPPAGRFTTADGSPIPAGEINFCVFRCEPQNSKQLSAADGTGKRQWNVEVLERHEFSSQAFVPMGGTPVQDGEGQYLVLVALPGSGAFPLLFRMLSQLALAFRTRPSLTKSLPRRLARRPTGPFDPPSIHGDAPAGDQLPTQRLARSADFARRGQARLCVRRARDGRPGGRLRDQVVRGGRRRRRRGDLNTFRR